MKQLDIHQPVARRPVWGLEGIVFGHVGAWLPQPIALSPLLAAIHPSAE